MIDPLAFGVGLVGFIICYCIFKHLLKQQEIYDPFTPWEMWSHCRCFKCKMEFIRIFQRFEYVFQKKKGRCPICHAEDATIEVLGIFHVRVKSKRELEWEQLEAKWQT